MTQVWADSAQRRDQAEANPAAPAPAPAEGEDWQTPRAAACPACAVLPADATVPEVAPEAGRILLSLPTIHCAACISAIERDLPLMPGVRSARVNLTMKRVSIEADPDLAAPAVIARLDALGYEAHELDSTALSATDTDRAGKDLLMRLGVAGFAMMNIMLLSVAVWSGAEATTRDMFHLISGAIALPTIAFSGQPFFRSAFRSLRAGRLGMDVPISLAIILATGISLYETFHSGHHAYFDAAVMLTFFLLAGRYLDHRTRAVARSAAQELAALEVPRAQRLAEDGREETVSVTDLRPGNLIRVRPGARMPADGEITEGASELDLSLLTGETLPVWAGPGLTVAAGAVNLTGPLVVRVSAAGKDSSLHRMADLVAIAENARTRYTSLADRAARAYSPVVHLLALGAFAVWMWISGGDVRLAINIAAATLIITCPCALGLAVPAVVTAASGKLFRAGLLVKSGTALERLAEVDTVVFDKTGTLTMGTPVAAPLAAHPRADLEVALALADASSHPLSRALANACRDAGLQPAAVEDVREVPGYGVEGRFQGQIVRLGRSGWAGKDAGDPAAMRAPASGHSTVTSLRIGTAPLRRFDFADRLRPGAAEAVAALRAQGKDVWVMSGDNEGPVAAIAAQLDIANWRSAMLPEDKAAAVSAMAAEGRRVLMVGDGLNDTAALAAAHVSVSPASALDAARVASDVVLLGQDMRALGMATRLAVTATKRIRENFTISFVYNVVAVPVALLGFATPLLAALAMSVSSINVTLNALRLK